MMTDEGYLQTKYRDLKEKTEQLENHISDLVTKLSQFELKINQFQPILEKAEIIIKEQNKIIQDLKDMIKLFEGREARIINSISSDLKKYREEDSIAIRKLGEGLNPKLDKIKNDIIEEAHNTVVTSLFALKILTEEEATTMLRAIREINKFEISHPKKMEKLRTEFEKSGLDEKYKRIEAKKEPKNETGLQKT